MEGRPTQSNDGASELINRGGGGPVSVDDIICTRQRVIDESDGREQKHGERENKFKPLREGTSQGSRIAVISSLNSHRSSSLNRFSASPSLTGPISML